MAPKISNLLLYYPGNVKSDYFQWQKIDDFGKAAGNLLMLVFFDVCSSVFTCLIGYGICKINLIQVLAHCFIIVWSHEKKTILISPISRSICQTMMCTILLQVWLHVIKEFGLVFAIHQTYLLDYQFCIVESMPRCSILVELY